MEVGNKKSVTHLSLLTSQLSLHISIKSLLLDYALQEPLTLQAAQSLFMANSVS